MVTRVKSVSLIIVTRLGRQRHGGAGGDGRQLGAAAVLAQLGVLSSLHTLPKWLRNPDTLIQTVAAVFDPQRPRQFELRAPASVARSYNDSFEAMKAEMRGGGAARGGPASLSYRARLALLFSIRLACVVTAWHGNLAATLLISRGAYFPSKIITYTHPRKNKIIDLPSNHHSLGK